MDITFAELGGRQPPYELNLTAKIVDLESQVLMSQKPTQKTTPVEAPPAGQPASSPNYLLFGVGTVAFLILIVVAMVIITGGDVSETLAPASLSQTAAEGKTLFLKNNCATCHPSEGRAGGTGPRLSTTGLSDDSIRNTIRQGKGGMPANKQLSADEITKIIAYIRAIKPPTT